MLLQRFIIFILLSCVFPCIATAAIPANELTPEKIQTKIDNLPTRKLSETENNTVKQHLEQALQFTNQRNEYETKLVTFKQRIKDAPQDIENYRKQLEKLVNTPKKDITALTKTMSDTDLQQYFTDNTAQLNEWQNMLTEASSTLLQAQSRPEQIQTQVSNLHTQLQKITSQLATSDSSSGLSAEETLKLQAEQLAANAHIALLQYELNNGNTLQELANHKKNLLNQQIEHINAENEQLLKIIGDKKLSDTEQTVKDITQSSSTLSGNELLNKENAFNIQLSQFLIKSTERYNTLSKTLSETNIKLDSAKHVDEILSQQIKALKGSTFLFEILHQQKTTLPKITDGIDFSVEIAERRQDQFKLTKLRESFGDPTSYVNKLLQNNPVDDATRKSLLETAKNRQEIYRALQKSLTEIINKAVSLQLARKQLVSITTQVSSRIDQQMFWIPSNAPINLEWLKKAPSLYKQELKSTPWQQGITDIYKALITRPWLFIPLVLIIIMLMVKRQRISDYLQSLHSDIGNVKRDTQYHTPLAILFNMLLALPISLALALAGLALILDGTGLNYAYGIAFFEVAVGWLILYTTYRVLQPDGVATLHFLWDKQQVPILRTQVFKIGLLTLLMMVVVAIAGRNLDNISNDILGVTIIIACYLAMAVLIAKTIFNKKTPANFSAFRSILGTAFILMPLALMIATMLGYYYTSLKLTDRLINTIYAILIWAVIEGMAVRWLRVAARRLTYQRVIEKRQIQAQAREQGGEEEIIIEEPILDMETINQQTHKIIRMALLAGLFFALYYIWKDVLAVFTYLDNIVIYEYVASDNTTLVPLSLMGFIVAIIIFLITIFLVRNIPGVLEMLILSKLNLPRGSSYAITTLLSYILTGIGVSTTLGILGVSWGKLQWLVAALSVGLGFGLQEIFANFVSGIILLFERPIRIGDRITIGGVTGTVNRIQIRATRMTDTERKEVIIPNKTFVTSQLTNWTLTDTVTRIALTIGVGYDSDIDKVKQLLLNILSENPRVLKDPPPTVNFIEFGASTLNLQLSMLVNEIADRSATTDEINRKILTTFIAEGIDIPFHQIDITLKNSEGKELVLK